MWVPESGGLFLPSFAPQLANVVRRSPLSIFVRPLFMLLLTVRPVSLLYLFSHLWCSSDSPCLNLVSEPCRCLLIEDDEPSWYFATILFYATVVICFSLLTPALCFVFAPCFPPIRSRLTCLYLQRLAPHARERPVPERYSVHIFPHLTPYDDFALMISFLYFISLWRTCPLPFRVSGRSGLCETMLPSENFV